MARGGPALAAGKEHDANSSAAEGQLPMTEADDANHLTKIPNLLAALLDRLDRCRGVPSNLPCQSVGVGTCLVGDGARFLARAEREPMARVLSDWPRRLGADARKASHGDQSHAGVGRSARPEACPAA